MRKLSFPLSMATHTTHNLTLVNLINEYVEVVFVFGVSVKTTWLIC